MKALRRNLFANNSDDQGLLTWSSVGISFRVCALACVISAALSAPRVLSGFLSTTMDALSSEWMAFTDYECGDRVAYKIGDAMGVAAFECTENRKSRTITGRSIIVLIQ